MKIFGLSLICCFAFSMGLNAQKSVSDTAFSKGPEGVKKIQSIAMHKFRHNIISLNVADYILQKYNVGYDYLSESEKWRIRGYLFVDVKDQNYGISASGYSNWKISKHVTHIIGGCLQGEYIGSFYQDFYLKFRPTGYAIDPEFATGFIFTAADRFVFGLDAEVGPGLVFGEDRFKGVFLDVRLGVSVGVKF